MTINTFPQRTGVPQPIPPKSIYIAPVSVNAETVIANAITSLGTGTIYLDDGTYVFTSGSVSVPSGISIVGVAPSFVNSSSNNVFDAGRVYSKGTRLLGDATGTYDCLVGNNTDKGSPDAAFGDNTISNIHISALYIEGFRHPAKFGAVNDMGVYGSTFRDIWLQDNKEAFEFHNFVHCVWEEIYCRDETAGWGGGLRFVGSVNKSSVLLPGNSTFKQIEMLKRYRTGKGIRWEAIPDAGLNECYAERIEAFSFGTGSGANQGAAYTTDATFDSTADIAVTDGTQFEVGMPVIFKSSVHGFVGGTGSTDFTITYFVVSVVSNTIQLSEKRGDTAKVASGSSSETAIIKTGGFPPFSVFGDEGAGNSAINIKNSSFLGLDIEGGGDSGTAMTVQGMLNCKFEMAGVSGVFDNHFVVRLNTFCSLYSDQEMITDYNGTKSTLMSYFGNTRGKINSFNRGTGFWNGQIYGAITTSTQGADAQVGSGNSISTFLGASNAVRSDTLKGFVRITTGTGSLAAGNLFTITATGGKDFFLSNVFPLNANAKAVMQNIYVSTFIADTFTVTIGAAKVEYSGTDDTSSSAAFLTDSGESWVTNELIGMHIINSTDGGSHAVITANTATTVTATLLEGTNQNWDSGDAYTISRNLAPSTAYDFGYISM